MLKNKITGLLVVACIGIPISACAPFIKPVPAKNHFYIMQINDTYKIEGLEKGGRGGFARLRTVRKQLEKDGKVLLLHAGDLLYPSVMSKYLKARPIIDTMNLLDGDAAAFDPDFIATYGNHEFDNPDPAILLDRTAQSGFSWVSSNVRFKANKNDPGEPLSQRLSNVHERIIYEVDGYKLGLFGLTLDSQQQDYVAYDYAPATRRALVRKTIDQLRQDGAQMIIAVTHQNLGQDEWLAREFPEIAIIAGGHEHFYIHRRVGKTWIAKADSDNQSAVVYDIRIDPGKPPKISQRRLALDQTIAEDPQVKQRADQYVAELCAALKAQTGHDGAEIYGFTKNLLEGDETAVRGRETALGDFLTDTMRERMGTDIAFVNGGGIRINDNIPPGPITHYDLEGIFYFDNALVSFGITGAQLLDILRNSVSKVAFGDGRFLQVSGVRFKYHRTGADDDPAYAVNAGDVEVYSQGRYIPLSLATTYSVATTDFLWQSGYMDHYDLFQQGKGGSSPERLDKGGRIGFRATVEEALARLPGRMVTTGIEGRIVPVRD